MQKRLQKIDIFRALALLGMVIYHFGWDLSFFNYIPASQPQTGVFVVLARIVAGSFLFLAGFSLYLAHGQKFRPAPFLKRFSIICFCALLVTIASYYFAPSHFIYFGILHAIAVSALFGALLLYTPLILNCIIIVLCLYLPFSNINLSSPILWWLGLSQDAASSFDYVPIFPWFAFALFGQTVASFMTRHNWLFILKKGIKPVFLNISLQYLGRHSLLFYLLHQPLLIALIYIFSLFFPPSYDFAIPEIKENCIQSCSVSSDVKNCRTFCSCSIEEIEAQGLMSAYYKGKISNNNSGIHEIRHKCLEKAITLPHD